MWLGLDLKHGSTRIVPTMSHVRIGHRSLRVACSLEEVAAADRLAQWRTLLDGAEVEDVAGGVRLMLRSALGQAALGLIAREARCCPFLDFELVAEAGRLRLDITSPVGEAEPVVAAIVGRCPGGESDAEPRGCGSRRTGVDPP